MQVVRVARLRSGLFAAPFVRYEVCGWCAERLIIFRLHKQSKQNTTKEI